MKKKANFERFVITENDSENSIEYVWHSGKLRNLGIVFSVIFIAIILQIHVWVLIDIFLRPSGELDKTDKAVILALGTAIPILVLWISLAFIFNKTKITVNKDQVKVSFLPIPVFWLKSWKLETAKIFVLEISEKRYVNNVLVRYADKDLILLYGFRQINEAKYVKMMLEKFMAYFKENPTVL